MPEAVNTSSSPPAEERLKWIPLDRLHPHPRNSNVMSEERLEKLARNIELSGKYPPPTVRPHPSVPDAYEEIDGHQRIEVLRRLGHRDALCYVWPCDDAEALVLLATLNRLEGEDVPAKRAELLDELSALLPADELALLLPESAEQIADTLALVDLDADRLLAELEQAAAAAQTGAARLLSFAVLPPDEPVIERAIDAAIAELEGRNRRGRALALLARSYLEGRRNGA